MQFADNAEVDERFLSLGREGGVDTVLDFKTGNQVYTGKVYDQKERRPSLDYEA